MQSFNPFLKSFFDSRLSSRCSPVSHYILLVPPTELLLNDIDQDSSLPYTELVRDEDFLASHIICVPPTQIKPQNSNVRDNKAKPKQLTTLNGKTLIVKDNLLYSNKGFKSLSQAQIIHDGILFTGYAQFPGWLLYHVSRPFAGIVDPTAGRFDGLQPSKWMRIRPNPAQAQPNEARHDIFTFQDLLANFPAIASQVQRPLHRLIDEKVATFIARASEANNPNGAGEPDGNIDSEITAPHLQDHQSHLTERSASASTHERFRGNSHLRDFYEDAVTAAVSLFQSVDGHQLALLQDTTNVSATALDLMVERYVSQQLHSLILFPRVQALTEAEDQELAGFLKRMSNIDISQVGLSDLTGFAEKQVLLERVARSSQIFNKMNSVSSAQEMLGILVDTQSCLSSNDTNPATGTAESEKIAVGSAVNADTLVSLLLITVIRSSVQNLNARFTYMRDFNLFTDVEHGQSGYVLSTFEGVLLYLSHNSEYLCQISRTNSKLWRAVRHGDISTIESLLAPDEALEDDAPDNSSAVKQMFEDFETNVGLDNDDNPTNALLSTSNLERFTRLNRIPSSNTETLSLSTKKRVSLPTRSPSSSSAHSNASAMATSLYNMTSTEITPEQLCQTQDAAGDSILFMAIESLQSDVLSYLLRSRSSLFGSQFLEYRSSDGATVLNAAVQRGDARMLAETLDCVLEHINGDEALRSHLAIQDKNGRSIAHYLFSAPQLLSSLGLLLPWTQKDKNGQTPLFTVCRSYDHDDYAELVSAAISATRSHSADGTSLRLDDHIDSKGNTLLHVVSDERILHALLRDSDCDPNAVNLKSLTPLMVATKFARLDLVHRFVADPRTDLNVRDLRGLTAVEVAKDENVRSQIDDLVLVSSRGHTMHHRKITVVRALLVADGSVRFVIKSALLDDNRIIAITTCRRSLKDFQSLFDWLSLEHPASWLPRMTDFRSPFQIAPRPSKQILRDMQLRVDGILNALTAHPAFGLHEMLWEFILVQDIDLQMLAQRSKQKAAIRVDNLEQQYTPLLAPNEVAAAEVFLKFATDSVRHTAASLKTALVRTAGVRNIEAGIGDVYQYLASQVTPEVNLVDSLHVNALTGYAATLTQSEASPSTRLLYAMVVAVDTSTALLKSLDRANALVETLTTLRNAIERHDAPRTRGLTLPAAVAGLRLFDAQQRDVEAKAAESRTAELQTTGRELRHTQAVVAGELAGWQDFHAGALTRAVRDLAVRMVQTETNRLRAMQRATRGILKPQADTLV